MTEKLTATPNAQLQPVVVDPHHASVAYVDWIVTSGLGPGPGIVNIDLAALDHALVADSSKPQAIMQCRLRMSLLTAQHVIRTLQQFVDASKPAGPDDSVN